MKSKRKATIFGETMISLIVILCIVTPLSAQTHQGWNAVWGAGVPAYSPSFIDASVFVGPSPNNATDLCSRILGVLISSSYPAAGAVIDARGIKSTDRSCPPGVTPWVSSVTVATKPATILLPAGQIAISTGWQVLSGTRIIGAGAGGSVSTGVASVTTIQAASGFPGGAMIQMGTSACTSSASCFGISVEDLSLDGNNAANTNGIVNNLSQELSVVRRVNMFNITGTGLTVSGSAQNSGPYSDIRFENSSTSAATSTVCAQINGVSTRGIHGLSCLSNNTPNVAVLLDAFNNSIEDVRISGFHDGIRIGSQQQDVQSNVIFNVSFNNSNSTGTTNAVYIERVSPSSLVADLSIMGVSISGSSTHAIQDDETGTTISDPYVGMYVLGQPITIGLARVYSRFSTSPSVPTWGIGNAPPSQGSQCPVGSLFSNTTGVSGNAFFVCTPQPNGWSGVLSQ